MLEFVIIAVLIGGFALLWDRLKGLERRLSQLELHDNIAPARAASILAGDPAPDPVAQPQVAEPVAEAAVEPATPIDRSTGAPASKPEPVSASQQLRKAEAPPALTQTQDQQEDTKAPRFQFDFEDIFGRRLPIWAGGIALAISGIFMVRYSIEAGLVTPRVRVLLSMVFGLGLIAGAEAAYRFELKLRDERVRQALAGAGLATLFGSFYLAGSGYGLIGAGVAFAGLAAVTAAAITLSTRFGLPCAIVGLVGGFAAPMLVDSDGTNVPLLALYLALVTGGLAWTGQRQGRSWLGFAAMAAGLGWGVLIMLGGIDSTSDILAFGGFLIVMGTVLPAFMGIRSGPSLLQIGAGAIATLQMAYLVDEGGYSFLTWGLYLLIAAALGFLGWRNPALRVGSAGAAAVGLWLLAFWPSPATTDFLLVCAAQMVIFAGVPLALQWRGKATLLDIVQLSVVALITGILVYGRYGFFSSLLGDNSLAQIMAVLTLFPAVSFAVSWRSNQTLALRTTLAQLISGGLLTLAALLFITPGWMAPAMAAIVAIGLAALVHWRKQTPLHLMAWAGVMMVVLMLAGSTGSTDQVELLFNNSRDTNIGRAILRWGAVLASVVALWFVLADHRTKPVASGLAGLFAYGLAAQVIPGDALAWVAALGAVAVVEWRKDERAAWATLLAIAGAWTLLPLFSWCAASLVALIGVEFLAPDAISAADLFKVIAPTILAAGLIAWRHEALPIRFRQALVGGAGAMTLVSVHSLYKGAWNISNIASFEALGLAERTMWQAVLLGAAIVVKKFGVHRLTRPASIALIAAALGHFAWFTLVLHNPLWASQHVGSLPIVNWITAAYGVALAGLMLGRRLIQNTGPHALRIAIDGAMMALIAIMVASLLRQIFAGSLLNQIAIGQSESLLLSLLGIVLALGFLWWGSRQGLRSWRVGSLVLMLLAVLKVFLSDAAGLDGLLRIASFMALGFSLIGIGWFYTRQLKSERAA